MSWRVGAPDGAPALDQDRGRRRLASHGLDRRLCGRLELACLGAASASLPAQRRRAKPNILVIWGDDIGWYNISAYNLGVMGYQTPNIDRIAGKVLCSPTGTGSRAAPPGAPRCSRETDHDDHHPRPGGSNDEAMLCARHTRGGRTLGPGCGPSGHGADGRAARAAVRPRGHGAGARRQAPLRPLRRPLRGRPGDDPAAVAGAARRHRGGDEELPDLAPGDRRAHGRGR